MNKKIIITTGTLKETAQEFVDVWRQIEKGKNPKPIEKVVFQNQRLLFKSLTPKRFEVLEYLHAQGRMSIRILAKNLKRDYSNVHQDVKILCQLGLILKDKKDNTLYVPWDTILTELPLSRRKKLFSHSRIKDKMVTKRVANG